MSIIPQQEAARYGDTTFGLIMMAKVICVHLVSDLGYDMLFQDVDVVWYKDPFQYFHDEHNPHANFDVYFQGELNYNSSTSYASWGNISYLSMTYYPQHSFKTMATDKSDLLHILQTLAFIIYATTNEASSYSEQ